VCVSVCVIRHAMRVHHIVICDLPGCTKCFHIISIRAQFSTKKFTEHKMPVFISPTFFFSETFRILRKTEPDMIENVY